MSYPRKIHSLIVEDERMANDNYRDIFDSLKEEYDLVDPRFARSVGDATNILKDTAILHLLILDLGLPLETRGEAMTGIAAGSSVLELAIQRDSYPIPAVVIISGRLGIANLTEIDSQLKRSFWHGVLVNKGVDEYEAIEMAIKAIHQYCDVGIHVRDSGGQLCPTLTPREEDILRRCVLSQQTCIGLDIEWWGDYEHHAAGVPGSGPDVPKVLSGNFLLDEGMGVSHTSFFKFRSADGAAYTRNDAEVMVQKHSHIKVLYAIETSSRSLLVTQKVGESQSPPISLSDYLRKDSDIVQPQISSIVGAIGSQLDRLGQADIQEWPANRLIWKHLSREKLTEAWSEYGPGPGRGESAPATDPLVTFDALRISDAPVYVPVRPCTHGDLNATNIALDVYDDGRAEAYIFDAEGVHPDVNVRDLATLEVTSLLHHALDGERSLVDYCKELYEEFVDVPDEFDCPHGDPLVRNTRRLIAEIRRYALQRAEEPVYAIVVFDAALRQLGGLACQRSGNKIVDPSSAAMLASYTASWCMRVLNRPQQ